MSKSETTFVICALGQARNPFELLPTTLAPGRGISGGERSLYELSCALSALGHSVELRGEIDTEILAQLTSATGAEVLVESRPARRPTAADTIIVPEGLPSPIDYAAALTSPGRRIMLALAPTGLFGWPFLDGWSLPDPLTVALDQVNTRDQLAAITASGFELWTHSRGIADSMASAGVEPVFIGCGQPLPPPDATPINDRAVDVVYVGNNRWSSLAREAARGLEGIVVELPPLPRDKLLVELARAKLLLLPARVEGTARIQIEARSVGTVPLCLPNPYGEGLSDLDGAVVGSDTTVLHEKAAELLRSPERLTELSNRAMAASARTTNWSNYVERVCAAVNLRTSVDGALHSASTSVGNMTATWLDGVLDRLDGSERSASQKHREIEVLVARVDELTAELLAEGDRHGQELAEIQSTLSYRAATYVTRKRAARRS